MEWSKLQDEKELFIRDMILSNTIGAAFQWARVYKEKPKNENQSQWDEKKEEFRKDIGIYLVEVGERYDPINDHCERIQNFKKEINNARNYDILVRDEISFGVAQKLVNLYLKYLWCLGKFDIPPHCPIDRLVINEGCQHPNRYHPWTQMPQEKYVDAMNEIKQKAGNESLAVWELNLWNDRTSVDKPGRKKSEKDLQIK